MLSWSIGTFVCVRYNPHRHPDHFFTGTMVSSLHLGDWVSTTDPPSRQVDPRRKLDNRLPSVNTADNKLQTRTYRISRWLTNEQAVEDSARFMAHVKFDGIGEDLNAPNTPWIYYGVGLRDSYAYLFLTGNIGILRWSSSCPHASPISGSGLRSNCFQR